MKLSKLKKLEKEYINLCKNNDYEAINICYEQIINEIKNTLKNNSKYKLLVFKYLLKNNSNHLLSNKLNLNNLLKDYSIFKFNKLQQINTKESILYDLNDILILDFKNTKNDKLLKVIRKKIDKNCININIDNKNLYCFIKTPFSLSLISNYLNIFINKLLILNKNNEINILIGYNGFKPKFYNLKYIDEGLMLDSQYFIKIKYINDSLNDIFKKIYSFNNNFITKLSNEVHLKLDLFLEYDNDDYDYSATANKYKKEITLYNILNSSKENIKRLLAHEIGHFYYWEYNNVSFNSNEFFKDFKNNYSIIKNKYEHLSYYFQFNPNGQYKFNKKSEYFCELFSLYLCNELEEQELNIFKKYFDFER